MAKDPTYRPKPLGKVAQRQNRRTIDPEMLVRLAGCGLSIPVIAHVLQVDQGTINTRLQKDPALADRVIDAQTATKSAVAAKLISRALGGRSDRVLIYVAEMLGLTRGADLTIIDGNSHAARQPASGAVGELIRALERVEADARARGDGEAQIAMVIEGEAEATPPEG